MVSAALALDPDGSSKPMCVERRAYPRFRVSLAGTCAVEGGEDAICTALDVSLGGLALRAKVCASADQAVSVSLPQIGLVRGRVVRTWADGFALRFDDSAPQRRRVTTYLTWLLAREREELTDDRGFERVVPLRRLVTLTMSSGTSCMARIIDMSRSGVAVTTTAGAEMGDTVRLDSTAATVVRRFEGGLAAQFATQIEGVFDASVRL